MADQVGNMNGIVFLFDEDVPEYLGDEVIRLEPAIEFTQVGQELAPPKGTPDPDLLLYAESQLLTFVTRDKRTMPGHIRSHFRAGHHLWGVFMLKPDYPTKAYAEHLVLIWTAHNREELLDWSDYLPW